MEVYIVPNGGDNFMYYLTMDKATKPGIFIDVWEPAKAQQFLQTQGIEAPPTMILTTHKHGDHSGGNVDMRKLYPDLQVLGGEVDQVPGATAGVVDKQVFEVNDLRVTCYHTPCHTRGHICFYIAPASGE